MDPATPLSPQNPFERIDNALKHIKQPIVETAAHARWAAKAQLQRLCTPLPSYDSWSLSSFNSGSHTGAQDNLCALNGNPRVIWWESWTLQAIPDLLLLLHSLQPNTFASEEGRVAYVIGNLTGRLFHEGTAVWGRLTPTWATFQAWPEHQSKVFIFWTSSCDATRNLLSLCQENRSKVVFLVTYGPPQWLEYCDSAWCMVWLSTLKNCFPILYLSHLID